MLEGLKRHHTFVENSPAFREALASTGRIEEVPEAAKEDFPVLLNQVTALADAMHFKEHIKIITLPNKLKGKGKVKALPIPVVTVSDGDKPLDWGTDSNPLSVDDEVA